MTLSTLGVQTSWTRLFYSSIILNDLIHLPFKLMFEQKFPEGKIIRCPGKEAIESLFMSAVKEVTTACKVIASVLIFFEVVIELHYQNACYFLLQYCKQYYLNFGLTFIIIILFLLENTG